MHGNGNKIWYNMRNIVYLFVLCSTYTVGVAQTIREHKPGIMWYYSGLRPAKTTHPNKYDRLVIDLTYNDWMGDRKPFHNKPSSIGANFNFLTDIPLNKSNTFSIGTGLTYGTYRVNHHYVFHVHSDGDFTQYDATTAPSGKLEKSIFGGSVVSIPLEFRFRTKGVRHFKFHMGGKLGFQTKIYSKTVVRTADQLIEHTIYDFPDDNRWIYAAHVRFGNRNWSVYGSYNLNKIFNKNSSSQLNLFQIGLSLSLF